MADPIAIAVLAKAPVAGVAKTRLIPALGAEGAAALAERLIVRAVATACLAEVGPVTLWAAPDDSHPVFGTMRKTFAVAVKRQPDSGLGGRMHTAVTMADGPALVIGTDCPAFTADNLRAAAAALRTHPAVITPAEDGGYVLIGLRRPQAAVFGGMKWGTSTVMAETRVRLQSLGLEWHELPTLWDVDRPEDLHLMRREAMLD